MVISTSETSFGENVESLDLSHPQRLLSTLRVLRQTVEDE